MQVNGEKQAPVSMGKGQTIGQLRFDATALFFPLLLLFPFPFFLEQTFCRGERHEYVPLRAMAINGVLGERKMC